MTDELINRLTPAQRNEQVERLQEQLAEYDAELNKRFSVYQASDLSNKMSATRKLIKRLQSA